MTGSTEPDLGALLRHLDAGARTAAASVGRRTEARPHDRLHALLGSVGRALRGRPSGVPLHAAACDVRGRGLIAAGSTGSGKSTLVVSLALERAASVVSDDMVWLDGDGRVSGWGRPLCIRGGSPWWRAAMSLPYADPGGSRVLLLPEDLAAPAMIMASTVEVLVFPSVGTTEQIAELEPAAAFAQLLRSVQRPLSSMEMLELATVVNRVDRFSMTYFDVRSSLALCDEVLDGGGQRAVQPPPELLHPDELPPTGEVTGIRFGDDVVLVRTRRGDGVLLKGWRPGEALSKATWDEIKVEARLA